MRFGECKHFKSPKIYVDIYLAQIQYFLDLGNYNKMNTASIQIQWGLDL